MVRDYELMCIVRPDVDDDGLRAAGDSVKALIEGQGGEVRKVTSWGKRRLAYEVKHLRDGHYVIAELRLDGAKVAEVERALRIHDAVFRHLLVLLEVPSADAPEGEDGEVPAAAALASPDGAEAAPDGATASPAQAEAEAGDATDAQPGDESIADTPTASNAEPDAAATATEAPDPEPAPPQPAAVAPSADDDEEA
jgi:small subunit ribosomal protein S6